MMESIPLNINKDHVLKALKRIDDDGVPARRMSRKFNVNHKGRKYPPKYVISVANEFANRHHLEPKGFITYHAQSVLKRLGFETLPKRK